MVPNNPYDVSAFLLGCQKHHPSDNHPCALKIRCAALFIIRCTKVVYCDSANRPLCRTTLI